MGRLLRIIRFIELARLGDYFEQYKIRIWGCTVNGGRVRVEMILISGWGEYI